LSRPNVIVCVGSLCCIWYLVVATPVGTVCSASCPHTAELQNKVTSDKILYICLVCFCPSPHDSCDTCHWQAYAVHLYVLWTCCLYSKQHYWRKTQWRICDIRIESTVLVKYSSKCAGWKQADFKC